MRFVLLASLLFALPAAADVLPTPAGSAAFGRQVVFLPNGNFVVTDPQWFDGPEGMGAVYLYSSTGTLIDAVHGSRLDDSVGGGGVIVLGSGNFVVVSPDVDAADGTADVGAVTFGDADTGFAGGDAVDTANSLMGSHANDRVGATEVLALATHYVVASADWNGATGAVTWGNGLTGTVGSVGGGDSLVGSAPGDRVGSDVVALTGGDYVVASPAWDAGGLDQRGAVTLRPGDAALPAVVSSANSLVGTQTGDRVGSGGVTPLLDGPFVIASPLWNRGPVVDAGAVTWHDPGVATSGEIDDTNSLVGATAEDRVGSGGVIALSNGNYAVASPLWDNGADFDVGAISIGSGKSGRNGAIADTTDLVGQTPGDEIGREGLVAVGDGNAVALSSLWSGGFDAVGAATWVSGDGSTVGLAHAGNSLTGMIADDLDFAKVVALANGNYVVNAMFADTAGQPDSGAVTWCSGNAPCAKSINTSNSLFGKAATDNVGAAGVYALADGNYAVASPTVDIGAWQNAGAVTWGDGAQGVTGGVDHTNSIVGRNANDQIGAYGIAPLAGGEFVILSPLARMGGWNTAGALTHVLASDAKVGVVDESNSAYGTAFEERAGLGARVRHYPDGTILAALPTLGTAQSKGGAVTAWHDGALIGKLDAPLVAGMAPKGGSALVFDYSPLTQRLLVGDPTARLVHLVSFAPPPPDIFRNGFE